MNCTNDPKMDESILEECRKIFEESTPIEKIDWGNTKTIQNNEDTGKNKRNSNYKHSEPPQKKKYMITPAHLMAKRLQVSFLIRREKKIIYFMFVVNEKFFS